MSTAFLSQRVSIKDVAISLFVSFWGNLAGSLFFACVICGYGGVFEETQEYRSAVITFVLQKAREPMWHQIFLRGIGANWLVCIAVYLSIQSREVGSKIIAIWWPTATFVALAFDHLIANMFFIPLGIFVGAPISVGYYIWKSLIPTLLGNFVGGGIFVGAAYWYLYITGETGVQISFDIGAMATAEGGAGPTRISGRDPAEMEDSPNEEKREGMKNPPSHGSGQLMSTYGSEMGDHSRCKSYSNTFPGADTKLSVYRCENVQRTNGRFFFDREESSAGRSCIESLTMILVGRLAFTYSID